MSPEPPITQRREPSGCMAQTRGFSQSPLSVHSLKRVPVPSGSQVRGIEQ